MALLSIFISSSISVPRHAIKDTSIYARTGRLSSFTNQENIGYPFPTALLINYAIAGRLFDKFCIDKLYWFTLAMIGNGLLPVAINLSRRLLNHY